MKENLKRKVEKRFKDIHFSKIILYKNPNEFCSVKLERVNPNHVGILWGRRKKSLNKGSHYIKWGKVYFSFIPVMVGLSTTAYIDMVTGYAHTLLVSIGLSGIITIIGITTLLHYLPFKLGDNKCRILSVS